MKNNSTLRALYIAKILYERTDEEHSLTTKEISDILENEYGITSHRQTIKSEIQTLVDFGLDIQEVRATQNKYNLVGRDFDISELKLLIDAVLSSKFITKDNSNRLVQKLGSLAGIHGASVLQRNVNVEGRIKTDNKKVNLIIDKINQAINEKKCISFKYFRYDSEKRQTLRNGGQDYVITPLNLIWNGDYYYMIGVYDYKQKLGNFRVDRIANVPVFLDKEPTDPPSDYDVNLIINSSFRMFDGKRADVILECSNNVMDSIIDRFGEGVEVVENLENTFLIHINCVANHVFYSWVFGFGGKVKIKSPDYVVMAYENMLTAELDSIKKSKKCSTAQ